MEILLAGPGTGKTTKIKSIIKDDYPSSANILVLSFTNATVNDLRESFNNLRNVKCFTLHSYALKINHLPMLHILNNYVELSIMEYYADKLSISVSELNSLLDSITFDEMIMKCVDFLNYNKEYASEKIGDLDLLIVDEYQDFNENERNLISIISEFASNTIILGDDDQSIYDFKDADPDGIIELYNSDLIEKLDHHNTCYRCPDIIVERCSNLITKNKNRIFKNWNKSGKKGSVFFKQCMTQEDTFRLILQTVQEIKRSNPEGTFLILSPVRFYIDELIEIFGSKKIPINNFWAESISKEDLVKIWWLKSIFTDNKILFLLFICKEFKLWSKLKFRSLFFNSINKAFNKDKFVEDILNLNYLPTNLANFILSDSTLEEFFSINSDYIHLREYIDEESLFSSITELERNYNAPPKFDKRAINLMSIHKSKGLQADYVFIYGLNEGVIPNEITGLNSIEAQRRLLFVGMTRTLSELYLLSTVEWDGKYIRKVDKSKFKFKPSKKKWLSRTSRFISELEI